MNEFQRMAQDDREFVKAAEDMMKLLDREPERSTLLKGLDLPQDATREAVYDRLLETIRKDHERYEVWRNDTYQVAIYNKDKPPVPSWPRMVHLSIKRIDREIIRDWRELQEIKNRLIGRENEAVELFPAESRKVDMANQYHLFVLADPTKRFPFGFTEGFIADQLEGSYSKQRPLTETKG
jgi:hypothetical protein